MVNLHSPQEARVALNAVLEAKPNKNIRDVVSAVLASMDVGNNPVQYTGEEMSNARYLKANRNWVFDENGSVETEEDEEMPFEMEKSEKHDIFIFTSLSTLRKYSGSCNPLAKSLSGNLPINSFLYASAISVLSACSADL